MAQRISMAACLIIMLATLSLSGLVWHQSNQAMMLRGDWPRVRPLAQAKTIKLLPDHTRPTRRSWSNCGRWPRLRSSPNADGSPSHSSSLESNDGSPAVAYQASLEKDLEKPPMGFNPRAIRRVSDSGGRVDFGVVQPGDRSFEVSTSWDEEHTLDMSRHHQRQARDQG